MPITAVPPPDEAAKEAERQALKRDMIQIAAEMNRGLEDELKNFSRSFAEASSKAADLEQQWQRPADWETRAICEIMNTGIALRHVENKRSLCAKPPTCHARHGKGQLLHV